MLYIAEKPELARAIIEALGGGETMRGYCECGKHRVTWCFGHMLGILYAWSNIEIQKNALRSLIFVNNH